MNTPTTGYRGSSLRGDPCQYGISNAYTDNNTTNNVHGNSNTNFANVFNSYYNAINVGMSEESRQIHAWLSPLEPHRRHQDVRNRRLDGVGDWVLQSNEFESWCESRHGLVNPTLRCYGGQGVGKTYISSVVIDALCQRARGQGVTVLFFYCDYQAQKDQSAVNMIGSLLRQAASGAAGIPSDIRSAFDQSRQQGGGGLRLPDMVELFVTATGSTERVYICIDALDELQPEHRSELLRALQCIIKEAPNMRLFLTGRPFIRRELDKYLAERAYIINVVAHQADIASYVNRKLDDDDARYPDLMTKNLRNDIIETILERASEMFLLVALNIDAILGESSLGRRRKMLQKVATMGVDLDSAYTQTLQRIRDQKGDRSRLGMEVLMWISHAERPLRIDELCHALAAEMGSTDLDPENIRGQDTVLGSCLGLAVVDNETSIVRPIHYTLQEYLSRPGLLPDAHKTLAQSCLTYLNYKQVTRLPSNNASEIGEMPFLEYSSLYWGNHAKMEISDHGKLLALELLNRYGNHVSATLLLKSMHPDNTPGTNHPFSGLHCASYFGVDEVLAALIEMGGCDINRGDCMGYTPLIWAALQGNQRTVGLLLTRNDIDPDKPDNGGRTPLWWASQIGHEPVVSLLLARGGVNPDRRGDDGQTPLGIATWRGHEGVVRQLLSRDNVNPDEPDYYGRTPLWYASGWGHEGLVKLLLARSDVSHDKPRDRGQTPLRVASQRGHVGVVRQLLSRDDVNPDRPDGCGQTPLWYASKGGYEGVVWLLLAQDNVNPDRPGNDGQTPLQVASQRGHEGVVRQLLSRDDVNPDRPDGCGQIPLWYASEGGHWGVVELLLAQRHVGLSQPFRGLTSLQRFLHECDGPRYYPA